MIVGLSSACLLLSVASAGRAMAATDAGARISNIAHLDVPVDGAARSIPSNQVDVVVGELLDVVLSPEGAGLPAPIAPGTTIPLMLTNTGNGQEAFDLAGSLDGGTATVRAIAIDVDRDGRFDPAHDRLLDGGRTPMLASGARVALLAVLDPAAGTGEATALTVTARAATGTGAPGTIFAGAGDGGGDAVVGASGALARLVLPFTPGAAPPSLVKTQSVVARDGSSRPAPGAIVTYLLEARFPGPVTSARVRDAIPAGTAYVPGSLRLDAVPLSDAADADSGTADARGIEIVLGDIAAAATHLVQFQVSIQ